MILVTGGLGFIGLHTAQNLLDMGEDVVLTQFHVAREPDFIKGSIGKRAFVEQLDVSDASRFAEIGKKYKITGIVHLAVPGLGALSVTDEFRTNMIGLLNIFDAAQEWGVSRLAVASSSTVYTGVREAPLREDIPLSLVPGGSTETFKKAFEILSNHYGARTGLEVINLRIAGIWGPLYHSMSNMPSRMVHAAVNGKRLEDGPRGPAYEEDGGDSCYVKDCGRGIALLQLTETLNHRTYNVGSGRCTTNGELAAAIKEVIPEAELPLLEGRNPQGRGAPSWQDLTRITEDTGYEPKFTTETAIADYIDWLRAGNAE